MKLPAQAKAPTSERHNEHGGNEMVAGGQAPIASLGSVVLNDCDHGQW